MSSVWNHTTKWLPRGESDQQSETSKGQNQSLRYDTDQVTLYEDEMLLSFLDISIYFESFK